MGILSFFGFKDNIQKASDSMADMFYRMHEINPDYNTSSRRYLGLFEFVHMQLFGLVMAKVEQDGLVWYKDIVKKLMENDIGNMTELVVADLNINASLKQTPYQETYDSFHTEIEQYLIKHGIPPQYVYGDNTEFTHNIVAKFVERLN